MSPFCSIRTVGLVRIKCHRLIKSLLGQFLVTRLPLDKLFHRGAQELGELGGGRGRGLDHVEVAAPTRHGHPVLILAGLVVLHLDLDLDPVVPEGLEVAVVGRRRPDLRVGVHGEEVEAVDEGVAEVARGVIDVLLLDHSVQDTDGHRLRIDSLDIFHDPKSKT